MRVIEVTVGTDRSILARREKGFSDLRTWLIVMGKRGDLFYDWDTRQCHQSVDWLWSIWVRKVLIGERSASRSLDSGKSSKLSQRSIELVRTERHCSSIGRLSMIWSGHVFDRSSQIDKMSGGILDRGSQCLTGPISWEWIWWLHSIDDRQGASALNACLALQQNWGVQ